MIDAEVDRCGMIDAPTEFYSISATANNMSNQTGSDLFGIVMTVVQIVGMTCTAVCLRQWTRLPLWGAVVLGIPLFLVTFWGALWLLSGRK